MSDIESKGLLSIRSLAAHESQAIDLVAGRMIETLAEVLGPTRGARLYTLPQALDRVHQHLDPARLTGIVYIAQLSDEIVGHCILRLDKDEEGQPVGLFATIYVVPEFRRRQVADALLAKGEDWIREQGPGRALSYTDKNNTRLHRLFETRGYRLTPMPDNFVALSRLLVS